MYNVSAGVFTGNYPSQQFLHVWVEVSDTKYKNTPENIADVQINAPDGSVFHLNIIDHWDFTSQEFWASFSAENFVSKTIPAGLYTIMVTPKDGFIPIKKAVKINGNFLPVPVATVPTEGSTIGEKTTFLWNLVPGATCYRMLLYDEDWGDYVYGFNDSSTFTNLPGFVVPSYKLKPNSHYRLKIEARDAEMGFTTKRSRTDWIHFSTGSWGTTESVNNDETPMIRK